MEMYQVSILYLGFLSVVYSSERYPRPFIEIYPGVNGFVVSIIDEGFKEVYVEGKVRDFQWDEFKSNFTLVPFQWKNITKLWKFKKKLNLSYDGYSEIAYNWVYVLQNGTKIDGCKKTFTVDDDDLRATQLMLSERYVAHRFDRRIVTMTIYIVVDKHINQSFICAKNNAKKTSNLNLTFSLLLFNFVYYRYIIV